MRAARGRRRKLRWYKFTYTEDEFNCLIVRTGDSCGVETDRVVHCAYVNP